MAYSLSEDEARIVLDLQTLSVDEVIRIYDVLVADFASSGDPIGQMGLRSRPLLESAIGRQHAGQGQILKYPDPSGNAATLAFGICCDHPFVNGNKRTALVAMLVHLDKNNLCLRRVSQPELYDLMVSIANHEISLRREFRRVERHSDHRSTDSDVAAIRLWIHNRIERLKRGERTITFRQLRGILSKFNIALKDVGANSIGVFETIKIPGGFFRREPRYEEKKIGSIGYRDEGTEVSVKDLKALRRMCRLTEADGVDSNTFYDGADSVDAYVNRYRTVLRRLAKT